jgi:hypothetical protein
LEKNCSWRDHLLDAQIREGFSSVFQSSCVQ